VQKYTILGLFNCLQVTKEVLQPIPKRIMNNI